LRIRSAFKGAVKFASGDHIHSTTQVDEETEKGQIGIGLCRITGEVRHPFESLIENGEMPDEGLIAVKIEGCSHFFSDLSDGNLLTVKLMIFIFKKMHPFPLSNADFGMWND
jgi:hypothetical protein